jgi:hypothetical protein
MKNFFKLIVSVALIAFLISLNSCRRDRMDDDITPASNHASADAIFSEAQNMADEASNTGSISFKTDGEREILGGCANVTRDTISSPRMTTIDFGTGCTGADMKVRKGQIIVTHTGKYKDVGTKIHITFNGYSVNGNEVSNNSFKDVENLGLNADNHLNWKIHVEGSVTLANGEGVVSWVSDRNREQLEGESTPQISDDKYAIRGTASGTTAKGSSFSATIDDNAPMLKDLTCSSAKRHFTAGKVTIQIIGKLNREIDFGNGACDNIATVSVNGRTRTIYL